MNELTFWLAAAVCSALMVPGCIALATKFKIIASPRNDRWNSQAIPLLGGLALWVSLTAITLFQSETLSWPIIGLALVFITGLVDDIRSLSPSIKTVLLSIAILLPMALGANVSIAQMLLLSLWILLLVNSINLSDNINGLAAGSGLIACIFLAVGGHSIDSLGLILLSGALAGFLPFNFPKARIFMGDAGSMTIGYWIGAYSASFITGEGLATSALDLLSSIVYLIVPLADTTFVIICRLARKQKISVGGKDHISHLLTNVVGSPARSVMLILFVQFTLSLGCISILTTSPGMMPLYTASVILLAAIACRLLLTRSAALKPDVA